MLRGDRPDLVQHYLTKVLAVNRLVDNNNKMRGTDSKGRVFPSALLLVEESTNTDGGGGGDDVDNGMTTRGPGPPRRLTAHQRQANHSASESKRRGNIRSGYQGLVRKVPQLSTTMGPQDVKIGVTHEIGYLLSGTYLVPLSPIHPPTSVDTPSSALHTVVSFGGGGGSGK